MEESKKISQLPLATELTGDERFVFAKQSGNGAITAEKLKEYTTEGTLQTVEGDTYITPEQSSEGELSLTFNIDAASKSVARQEFLSQCELLGGDDFSYQEESDSFTLNGVAGITWAQMREILRWYDPHSIAGARTDRYNYCPCKTLFEIRLSAGANLQTAFQFSFNIEVIALKGYYSDNRSTIYSMKNAFDSCRKLREIRVILRDRYDCDWSAAFNDCRELEEVRIQELMHSVDFRWTPFLSLASLDYMVTNAANTNPITITVHADIYAKLTGDEDSVAYTSLTAEEQEQWHALLLLAESKSIQFATT